LAADFRHDNASSPEREPRLIEPPATAASRGMSRNDVPAEAPDPQSPQEGRRKPSLDYREADNTIARDLLTERGWFDNPAEYRLEFWRLSNKEAPRLPGHGSDQTKTARLRVAIKRVTGF
jgi:hypothetical protein